MTTKEVLEAIDSARLSLQPVLDQHKGDDRLAEAVNELIDLSERIMNEGVT